MLYRTKKSPKKQTPNAATYVQSLRCGHRTFKKSAVGNRHKRPIPHRKIASVIGSAFLTRKRVTAAAVPPSELEMTAINTPNHSLKTSNSSPSPKTERAEVRV